MAWDIHTTTSEEWLIDLCRRAEKEKGIVGGLRVVKRVIRISEKIAAKIGYFVTATETATQKFSYEHVGPNIVYVLRVYRFF